MARRDRVPLALTRSLGCQFVNHYENTPMQYTEIFHGCKYDNFKMNIFYIFLILAQNIDCGYTLEAPQ